MNISKKDLSSALYLSCVENYFLAWISKYYSVEKLYSNSFISMKEVLSAFYCGASYENYSAIERIQETAERNGVVNHSFVYMNEKEALNCIKSMPQDELCLIRVKENFFEGFKRRAWRADHYICVDHKLNWLNQYPLSDGQFTEIQFGDIFDGVICTYTLADIASVPKDENNDAIVHQDLEKLNANIGLQNLESAVGILRITRRRLARYYKESVIGSLFEKEADLLDKLYFDIRFQSIKKTKPEEELYRKMDEIIAIEKEISERIYG